MAEASKQLMHLVRQMDSGTIQERAAARQQLADMGPLAITRLVAELQKTPGAGKKVSMLLLGVRLVLLPVLVIGVIIAAVLALVVATDGAIGCVGDVGCLGDLFSGWNLREQYHDRLHDRQWNQIARALAQLNDLRVAGPLAEALEYADARSQPVLLDALYRMLPLFTAEAAQALTPGQRSALYHHLGERKNSHGLRDRTLSLAILRIIVLAEDVQAVGMVEGIMTSAIVPEVASAAAHTAEELKIIAQRLQVSHSLLRGASAPTTAPEMLLRPAQGEPQGGIQQSEQLLRAVGSEVPTERPGA